MSWNSTHTAIVVLGSVVVAGMHYAVDLQSLAVVIAPLGAYIALRERSRIKNANN